MSSTLLFVFLGIIVATALVTTLSVVIYNQEHLKSTTTTIIESVTGGVSPPVTPPVTFKYDMATISVLATDPTGPLTPMTIVSNSYPLRFDSTQLPPLVNISSTSNDNKFIVDGSSGVAVTTLGYIPQFLSGQKNLVALTGSVTAQVRVTATTPTLTVQCSAAIVSNAVTYQNLTEQVISYYQFDTSPTPVDVRFNFTLPFNIQFSKPSIGNPTFGIVPAISTGQAGCHFSTNSVSISVHEVPLFINTPA